jgi:hypothetical protein
MTQTEALRLALEALENLGNHDHVCPQWPTYAEPENYPKCNCGYDQAITAIKAALANEALERKAENARELGLDYEPYGFEASIYSNARMKVDVVTGNVSIGTVKKPCGLECDCTDVCKQEAKDEPVALKPCAYESKEKKMCRKCGQVHAEAIWDTTPPQRKPLTDEEIEKMRHLIDWTAHWSYGIFARAIEAAHGIKGEA